MKNISKFVVCFLESASGNPILKKLAISKLIELKKSLNLCDIWQIRNPKSKTSFGIFLRRLDYLFISNNMQKSAKNGKIMNSLSTDHCFFIFF